MINDITICTITCNAGDDIAGSTLKWNLENQFKEFKRVIVVDGNLTPQAKEYYSKFQNVEVVDIPWRDSYVAQYQAWLNRIEDGEWAIHLDDDENLSDSLLKFFRTNDWKNDPNYLYFIPCVLLLTENDADYYAAEEAPEKKFNGQWTKSIIVKKHPSLTHHVAGSHVIMYHREPEINRKKQYLPHAYHHFKSLSSFVYNDVWQAFLHPEAQHFSPANVSKFKMFTSCYKNTKDFKAATKKGVWPPPLKKFAWDNRHEYTNPVSRLAWTYFILEGHAMPELDSTMTWENVKGHVLDQEKISIFQSNKKNNNVIKVRE